MALFQRNPMTRLNTNPTPRPAPRTPQAQPPRAPATLTIDGKMWTHGGRGRTPGSEIYLALADGRADEYHHATIATAQPLYLLARVNDNHSLGPVHLPRAALAVPGGVEPRVGQSVLVGPLSFDRDGAPRASRGWVLATPKRSESGPLPPPPMPVPSRLVGYVTRIHPSGAFGEIGDVAGHGGQRWFFHHSALVPSGCVVAIGQRVSFSSVHNDRGPKAIHVRPA